MRDAEDLFLFIYSSPITDLQSFKQKPACFLSWIASPSARNDVKHRVGTLRQYRKARR